MTLAAGSIRLLLRRPIPRSTLQQHSSPSSSSSSSPPSRLTKRPHSTKSSAHPQHGPPSPAQRSDTATIINQATATINSQIPPKAIVSNQGWVWLQPLGAPFRAYGRAQARRPYLTQFVSTLVIYFFGDFSAQSLRAPDENGELPPRDLARTMRALTIGGISSIPGYKWFMWLGESFNYRSKALSLLTKVVVNQIVFTPIFNTYFFAMQALLSGATLQEAWERVKVTVPVSCMNSCKLWPIVTAFNFTFISPEYRNIFGGVIAIAWQTYLSILNQRAARAETLQHEDIQRSLKHVPAPA